MRLIATRDFRNVQALGLKDENGKSLVSPPDGHKGDRHDDQVHKGTVFEIGKGDTLEKMMKSDPDKALKVAHLFHSGCVSEATEKNIAAVKAEVEVDRKREARAQELNGQAIDQGLFQQFLAYLRKGAKPATA